MARANTPEELLREVVAADLATRPDRVTFRVTRIESHVGPQIRHPGLRKTHEDGNDWLDCNRADIEDLAESGLIRLKKERRSATFQRGTPRTYWEEWYFDVRPAGLERVERGKHAEATPTDAPPGLDWQTDVLPVLEAAYAASGGSPVDLGASQATINERLGRDSNDSATARVLVFLVKAEYLQATIDGDQSEGPAYVALTERGLQITAGWPSGAADATLIRLLSLIDEHVEQAESDDERTKWQRLRDAVTGIGRDVAVEVITAAAQAGLKSVT